ncbi:MAG: Flagellar hook-associated protein 2 [Sphingomonas bacterium]|uniref:flagellar filament capping protein FliD n=1 Tax=Sphingomonas bacterium TaxID=1895847 RepID=UPI0026320A8C|nr:flagellar filament capping protein FliD [Sphingomonas bacterium]MDB5694840.1 Flagellar hook-associated protein 2 [Sphingomonas bacterium]
MTTAPTSSTASIVKTLGTGSGLDTGAIVSALVEAQFAAKTAQLTQKSDALTAQISGIAKLKSGITGFDAALRALVKGGSLATQPTSSVPGVATATAAGRVAGLSATLTVTRLAAAQAATTNTAVARTDTFRAGTLDITKGGATTSLAIAATDTLDSIAAKINGATTLGLTATVVTDGAGARLTIKGATGAANAFTISGSDIDAAAAGMSLADLSVGTGAGGTTIGTTAADAELVLDGAIFRRATNSVADLLAGVRLDLKATGTTTLGATPPGADLAQAVNDFVTTFNELQAVIRTELDPVTGALRADPAAATLRRSLGQLTTVSLATNADGAPRTLGDIGVRTGRDGTLSVDTVRLTKALTDFPTAVEAMFADGTGASNGGLAAALGAITTRATDRSFGFDAEVQRYTAVQADLAQAKEKAAAAAEQMETRLVRQFASMDARVAAYKSTQDFLKQQVEAWNKSD